MTVRARRPDLLYEGCVATCDPMDIVAVMAGHRQVVKLNSNPAVLAQVGSCFNAPDC